MPSKPAPEFEVVEDHEAPPSCLVQRLASLLLEASDPAILSPDQFAKGTKEREEK
jgi:hypothetical protein